MEKYLCQDLNALRMMVKSTEYSTITDAFDLCVLAFLKALRNNHKILVCGNGGSAADAEHMAGELVGRFGYDRPSLPCISLCTPSATFTAIANDYGYDRVFYRQVLGLGEPGDVLLGISTSGNSANVVAAFEIAKEKNITTIALTGSRDSKLSQIADICVLVPSTHTPRIQEIHGLFIHSICRAVEEEMFPGKAKPALPATKIIRRENAQDLSEAIKDHKAVFTNGCFDVLHPGHIYVMNEARKMGDLLIVGLNSDDSVKRLKGETRPYHNYESRSTMLAALEMVDYVVDFDEDTPENLIKTLTPKILVKGGDYSIGTIVGADWVLQHGGRVEVVKLLPGHSTTGILKINGN